MKTWEEVCREVFKVHDDIRHMVVADKEGSVLKTCSRAKYVWPSEMVQQMSGAAAAIISGIFEKTKEYGGDIRYIMASYERLKLFIIQGRENFFLVSARRTIPEEAVETLVKLLKSL
ncbi:MAG: roadblock/LC7 domain-containing protein [Candidatus Nezhaarchaeota archaeon]|nr:roadblock/LC7 domain-containing protein [Candidatus Nezhaarchaeota archaeon]